MNETSHVVGAEDQSRAAMIEIDTGLVGMFVDAAHSPTTSPRYERTQQQPAVVARPTAQEEAIESDHEVREVVINITTTTDTATPSQQQDRTAPSAPPQEGYLAASTTASVSPSQVTNVAAGARALQVPMRHRHFLAAEAIERGKELSKGHVSPSEDSDTADDVHHAVPEPRKSPSAAALGMSSQSPGRGESITPLGGNNSMSSPPLPLPTSQPTLGTGVPRSDIDDAWIMEQLLERQRTMSAMANNKSKCDTRNSDNAGSDDEDMRDDEMRVHSNTTGPSSPSRQKSKRRQRSHTIQDDIFLESLDLKALDDTVDWDSSSTFERRWLTQTFYKGRVERDFLRYEMHHHRLRPQFVFVMTVFTVVLIISIGMWVFHPTHIISVVWFSMLGACAVLVLIMIAAMRFITTASDSTGTLGGGGGEDDRTSSDRHSEAKQIRTRELRGARLAEMIAFALLVVCIWGTLSSYAFVTTLCYHPQLYYVSWAKDDCVNTTSLQIFLGGVDGSGTPPLTLVIHHEESGIFCPHIETFCQRALYPFVVPAVCTSIVLFRPRAFLSVPVILSAPFAFAASRFLAEETKLVDVPAVFWSKIAVIAVIALFASALKIALEREQRRRFRAYAELYNQLSKYVRQREALAEFLDAKVPPLLRSRLLSGNLSIDYAGSCTCITFDLAEFASWCTKMMPLAAATSVMQLHDVLGARCITLGVEKLRSVGDVFIGASNLAVASPDHAALCCQLALQVFSDAYQFRHAFAAPLALRCGMHTGSLIGMVLGSTYRRYDVLGDALATALRVLELTLGNQIVMTQVTSDAADAYIVTSDRSSVLNMSSRSSGNSSGSGGGGQPQKSPSSVSIPAQIAMDVTSPITKTPFPLRVLHSLKRLVPPCEAYVKLTKEGRNFREMARMRKKRWASEFNRQSDDARKGEEAAESSSSAAERSSSSPQRTMNSAAGHADGTSDPRQFTYEANNQSVALDRATFDVVRAQSAATAAQPRPDQPRTATAASRVTLVPITTRTSSLHDSDSLRDFVVLNSSSTAMLETAVAETRMVNSLGSMLKTFVQPMHEVEFSLKYLRVADRTPFVTALIGLCTVYAVIITVMLSEHKLFPPSRYNATSLTTAVFTPPTTSESASSWTSNAIVGASLVGAATGVAMMTACVAWFSVRSLLDNTLFMWFVTCSMNALSFFGVTIAAPGVVSSDATYLFFLSLIVLHFGSWSFGGLVLISVVNVGVFVAATNTVADSFLSVWSLPVLVIMVTLNMYFDRNRERRLREMYRDLFLTKAAVKAAEAEGETRRSVLRATLPRPLFLMVADTNNVGKLLTTTVNEAVVAQIRLDGLSEEIISTLSQQCADKIKILQQRRSATAEGASMLGDAAAALPAFVPEDGPERTPSFSPHGVERNDRDSEGSSTDSVLASLLAVHRASSIIEILLDSLSGTELAIVHVFGDVMTIAGPLEETDSRGSQHVGGEGAAGGGDAPLLPTEQARQKKLQMEKRVQRAAYDMMMLIAMMHRMNAVGGGISSQQPQRQSSGISLERHGSNMSGSGGVGGGSSRNRPFPFSAVCVSDTIINVLANSEYPTYDLLGAASYSSRVLFQQLPHRGSCIATEKFVTLYQEELKSVAAEEHALDATTLSGRHSSHNSLAVGSPRSRAASNANHVQPNTELEHRHDSFLIQFNPTAVDEHVTDARGVTADEGAFGSCVPDRPGSPTPPRLGERERWRVRGLGTVFVYNIFPSDASQFPM